MRVFLSGAAALAFAVIGLASPAGAVAGFGDVEEGRFYTAAVQWMVDEEITTGTSPTCFSPDDFVTRGQSAAFMWRMQGFPEPGPAHPFGDVVKDWQQEPISWMFNNGITTGTTPATFSPEDVLTRGQLAALLYRLEGNPPGAPGHPFTDVVSEWQQDAVSWMAAEDITTGTTPTTFSPDESVTRGQLAAFFYRYKGSPGVVIDPEAFICPDFVGPLQPQPGLTGTAGFKLTPAGDAVAGFLVTLELVDYPCPGTGLLLNSSVVVEFSPDVPIPIVGGSFEFTSFADKWSGRITGDSASGTVESEILLGFGDSCEFGPVGWTASRT